MAKSLMDYIFRRLALDYLPYETRAAIGIHSTDERNAELDANSSYGAPAAVELEASVEAEPVVSITQSVEITTKKEVHSSAELFELLQGKESDAPLCFNCGIKMRPSGSCHVCEGCGSTSGCS
jgi:ribonucleoside-diphosphate reductase alpha chain